MTHSQGSSTGTVLLTLGRLPKGLDLVRCLAKSGWRVLVAEPGKRHLCGSSRYVHRSFQVPAPVNDPVAYLDTLCEIINREQVDLVLPVSEETLHVAALRGHLPAGVTLACMPLEKLLQVHGKFSFFELCKEIGIPVPETCRLSDPEAVDLISGHDVVVKREYSCAGAGLEKLSASSPLPHRDQPSEWLVQRCIDGVEICSFTIARAGRALATVFYRGTVVSGTVAVCFERFEPEPAVAQWVERFIEGSSVSGFIGLDLMVDSDGIVYGLECNPRATSGVHFFEPQSLAAAILEPERCGELKLRERRLWQQFYPCLTETQMSLFHGKRFLHNLGQLIRAKDVTFSLSDPLPFLLLPYTAWSILSKTLFEGVSFGEAATWDIEWEAPGEAE